MRASAVGHRLLIIIIVIIIAVVIVSSLRHWARDRERERERDRVRERVGEELAKERARLFQGSQRARRRAGGGGDGNLLRARLSFSPPVRTSWQNGAAGRSFWLARSGKLAGQSEPSKASQSRPLARPALARAGSACRALGALADCSKGRNDYFFWRYDYYYELAKRLP